VKTTALKLGIIVACAVTLAAGDLRAQTYEAVHTFSGNRGRPIAALTAGPDGRLYGSTVAGGFFGKGSIFVTDGSTLTTLHDFDGSDGEAPRGRLLLGSDNALYGTTTGGLLGNGTVFRITTDGTLTTLVNFDGLNGSKPQAGLVEASDGNFYGTTLTGGAGDAGTIFRLTPDGALTTVVSFGTALDDGVFPSGSLIQAADGDLYGTTRQGGAFGHGLVFRMSLDGALTTVASFEGANGSGPTDGPIQASNGILYGTTSVGGAPCTARAEGCGTIYQITADGIESLHSFSGDDGTLPNGGLSELNGALYGTTFEGGAFNFGSVFRLSLDGAFEPVASFTANDGNFPDSGLTQIASGAIFGTTESGGPGLYGTIYEVMPDGAIRTAVAFTGTAGADPSSRLLHASDGNFYGTTMTGGDHGLGTVFRMTPDGVVTTLASFDGANGASPSGSLVESADGLYGTASAGGDTNDGTLYHVTLDGTLTAVSFDFAVSGSAPSGRMIEASDGNLYGTAIFHAEGEGSVFRLNRITGTLEAAAIFPMGGEFGAFPSAGVTEGPDGNLYGTAEEGGSGFGVIFRMSLVGDLSIAHAFDETDGAFPASPLLARGDGMLYGTTPMGGDTGDGTLFKVSLDGEFSTLASFDFVNGSFPYRLGVVEGPGGFLYGSTMSGGDLGVGVLYRWSPGGGIEAIHQFDGITGDTPNTTLISVGNALYGTAIGPQGGVVYRVTFEEEAEASLAVAPAQATYGGSTSLKATLTAAGAPIAGAEVSFSLNGVPVGSAVTGDDGVATLGGVPVAGIDAGSYPGAIAATYAGSGEPIAAQADLTIAQATPSVTVADASYLYDTLAHPAVASATGVGGESLGPVSIAYNGSAMAPIEPGTYAVVASFAGNVNYTAVSASATIVIAPAPAGVAGLVAAYGFEEGSGRIAADASGNGHTGRTKRSAWVANGRFGGALDFDGSSDWVTIADAADLRLQTSITMEAWVRPRSLSGWNTILLKEGDGRMSYALYANDFDPRPAGYVRINFIDQPVVGPNPLPLNTWTHVAMTYNGSMMRLYINGAEAGRRAMSGKLQTNSGPLRIGGNSIWGEYFNGLIDEVRIYNRELSAAEIGRDMRMPVAHEATAPSAAIASPADGAVLSGMPSVSVTASDNMLVSNVRLQMDGVDVGDALADGPFSFTLDAANGEHVLTAIVQDVAGNVGVSAPVRIRIANSAVAEYRFEEGTGTSVVDGSGRNNNGTISGGVTRVTDASRGRVLSFNGVDGLVTIADAASLDLTSGMTLEAWVRPTSVDGWRNVIMKERGQGLSYALYANEDSGKPSGYARIAGSDESVQGKKRLTASAWSHLAVTYDGTVLRLFLNGVEVQSRRDSGAISTSDGKLRIGGNKVWGEYFKGQIDDVRIYGVAVSPAQISADMGR